MVLGAFERDRNVPDSQPAMLLRIICGTVPAAVVGFLAQKTVEARCAVPSSCDYSYRGGAAPLACLAGCEARKGFGAGFPSRRT